VAAARTALAERLAALEDRVTGTIDTARCALEETTQTVRDTVGDVTEKARGLVDSSTHSLKEAFDFRKQIRAHPWEGAGFAVAAGLIAGLLSRRGAERRAGITGTYSAAAPAAMPRPQPSGFFGQILERARQELMNLGETAIASASQALQENVEQILPVSVAVPRSQPKPERMSHRNLQGNGQHSLN